MKRLTLLLLSFSLLFTFTLCQKTYQKKSINDNWIVNIHNCPASADHPQNKYQLQTQIPTNIHMDLLKHKKIQDPFFGSNWQQQKWISQCNANYKRNLSISKNLLQSQVINLVFEGIDTYSSIKLNSQQILRTQNAFVEYKINVKKMLKIGENLLQVQINSTKVYDSKGQSQNRMPFDYAHTRKPCYQYSWDWAPYMNSLGIWKNVYLQTYNQISIDYTWIQLQQLDEKQAFLAFSLKVNSNALFKQFKKYSVAVQSQGVELNRTYIAGHETYFLVKINQPKLWWPNGIGEPHMYNFVVKLLLGQKVIQQKHVPYGIRTVRLDQTSNAFTLYVNGYKIYCKGANYVPPDMLYPRLSDSKKIITLLEDTVRSNFNMIRLWGGGQYESDEFYNLASKMGIMIFHDFMFSDSIYPSNQEFLDNVLVEVVQQVRRIRNYPALVLWAGNNQILQGIQSWGWASEKYKNDYKKLFQQHIPNILNNQCPYIPYVPSSPVKGVGNGGFERGGDVHYWGVWAGAAPFQNYQMAVGPFNSQFGTQSLPVWQTIQQFTSKQGRSYAAKQLLSHERHGSQFHTLKKYMQMYGKQSKDFQLESYQSGLVQAYGIQIAIKAQRASKSSKSMGTLYWQLNDAWPAISWSAIDYFGRWKPLQYKAKNLFEDVIAFYHHKSKNVVVINDKLYNVSCLVSTKIVSFNGQIYNNYSKVINLRQNEALTAFSLQQDLPTMEQNAQKLVVYTKLTLPEGKQVSVSTFVKSFKLLQLPKCELHVKFQLSKNKILLAAKCLIKSLHLYHSFKYLSLTDNYIDIIPGEVHQTVLLEQDLKALHKQIKFRSYLQVYDSQELKVVYVN